METTVESPMISANPPQDSRSAMLATAFTKANASEMGRRSAEKRALLRVQAENEAKQRQDNPQAAVQSAAANDDSYRLNRLRMTREALDTLYDDLGAADDEKGKKAICDAIARLSEVERQLAGRPAPGSLRPAQAKAKRSMPESYGPVE